MHIGMLLEQMLAPVPGGTGRYTAQLAAALARTAGPDDAVTGWTAWHRDLAPARVVGVAGPRRLPAPRRALVAAWERGLPPAPAGLDVLHAPTPLFPRRRRPLVVTVHDAVAWTHPETLTARGVRWHRAMITRAAGEADAVTVPTQAVADELRAVVPGLTGRLHVLGAGVAPELARTPDAGRAATVAARLPARFVLTVATLEPRKGLDVLIESFARLGDPDVDLVVVGQPGWGGLDVEAMVRAAAVPRERVHLLGRIDDADLGVVLRAAQCLVVPSRAEGFGLPVIEAMAVGTPVVCTAVPALVEVAGDAALVVGVGDTQALGAALDHLLADAPLRAGLAASGLARARSFDWDEVAARAWALYRQLAGSAT